MPDAVAITCEHAVHSVPEPWQALFCADPQLLLSHRGWDPGAHELAVALAKASHAPYFAAQVTRLLADHNRSPHHPELWSEFSRNLPDDEKQAIIDGYYQPFRHQVGAWIEARIAAGERVLHLSVHSFTPVLDGQVRELDIGLLYDPSRSDEAFFAELWKTRLSRACEALRVRFNAPYRGRSDCHQSTYRKLYPCRDYIGIELEVNQALLGDLQRWKNVKTKLVASLQETLGEIVPDE